MGTQNLNWPPGPSPMNMVSKTNTPVLILPNKKAKMITVLSPVNTVLPFLMAEPKLFLILLTMNMDMLPMLDTKVRSFLTTPLPLPLTNPTPSPLLTTQLPLLTTHPNPFTSLPHTTQHPLTSPPHTTQHLLTSPLPSTTNPLQFTTQLPLPTTLLPITDK